MTSARAKEIADNDRKADLCLAAAKDADRLRPTRKGYEWRQSARHWRQLANDLRAGHVL